MDKFFLLFHYSAIQTRFHPATVPVPEISDPLQKHAAEYFHIFGLYTDNSALPVSLQRETAREIPCSSMYCPLTTYIPAPFSNPASEPILPPLH